MPPKDFIIPRRGTLAEWAAKSPSPVLMLGEIGVETDTHRMKCGDGVTAWSSLPYLTSTFDLEEVPVQVARDTDANLSALTDPFLSGQLVYGQTTGKTVIGDGESLYDDLPDLRKQFQNVVTVAKSGKKGSADFICSDYGTSDDYGFQAALDAAPTGSTISIQSGSYNLGGNSEYNVMISGKNLRIIGDGNVTMYGWAYPNLEFRGTYITTQQLVTDALRGTSTIQISDVSGVQHGDILRLYISDIWTTDYAQTTGETYTVLSTLLESNTIQIYGSLLRDYATSKSATAIIYHPSNIQLENITFTSAGSDINTRGIRLLACTGHIKNCNFYDYGSISIFLQTCSNFLISESKISKSNRAGQGYGIAIACGCNDIKIKDNTIAYCRHVVCGTAGSPQTITPNPTAVDYFNLNSGIIISGNTFIGSINYDEDSHVLDSHTNTIDYTVTDNIFYIANPKLSAFHDGTQSSIFSNNRVYGGGGVRRRGVVNGSTYNINNNEIYGGAIYESTSGSAGCIQKSLTIVGNVTNQYPISTIPYGIKSTSETFETYNISHNIINNCNGIGIGITTPAAININLIISENELINGGNSGVVINNTGGSVLNSKISNNIINGAVGTGILIANLTSSDLTYNTIDNVSGDSYGIAETGTSNNNNILYNTVKNTTHKISKVGADTKIWGNIGYKTENTGIATLTASSTSITVSHGLATTPTNVIVTPRGNLGSVWVDPTSITTTQFTIHCSSAPETDTVVGWSAVV